MIEGLRNIEPVDLTTFANELKEEIVARVSDKIPHLESSLAVAELTVALHYLLNTPEDLLIWDVGHQGYVHKALTGRLEALATQRTKDGISGFLKRDESPYDFFGAGHASTSLSVLTGACIADAASGRERKRVAVIGDGSMTGGQSFEALNHLATLAGDAVVVLNDNDGSIDPTVGALHKSNRYNSYVQSLGWEYSYLETGNDVLALLESLKTVIDRGGKQVLHIRTTKPILSKTKSYQPGTTFQWWAAEQMRSILKLNHKLRVFSPAMFASSGFGPLRAEFPEQFVDTGINEPHTVTAAAGMTAAGGRAWVHIYSTFLQRAMDQVIHDIALQNLPVVFLVDRAGLVGADGPTHHGVLDAGFLADVPNATVWNPRNGDELQAMMTEAYSKQDSLEGPIFIRYPKAKTVCGTVEKFEPKKWISRQGSNSLLLSTGALSSFAASGVFDHLHVGQAKPLPQDLAEILKGYTNVLILEEGLGIGGFFGAVAGLVADKDLKVKLVKRKISDEFTNHGNRHELLQELGLIP
jgi:1-deoxy-D-xylulose-5-phosphate synthase